MRDNGCFRSIVAARGDRCGLPADHEYHREPCRNDDYSHQYMPPPRTPERGARKETKNG